MSAPETCPPDYAHAVAMLKAEIAEQQAVILGAKDPDTLRKAALRQDQLKAQLKRLLNQTLADEYEELSQWTMDQANRADPLYFQQCARLEDLRKQLKPKPALGTAHPAGEELADPTLAPPRPTAAMFYGLAGEVARAATAKTGISPVAVAANFLSFLGAMVGRDMYYSVADTKHHPRLFTLHVGRSGKGGKGDAVQLVRLIANDIQLAEPHLIGTIHDGGLSSKEGMAMLIHDGFTLGRETTPPILDKRLWVQEDEFGNVLQQGKREGNTLSEGLRAGWDGRSIKPANKNSKIWASQPHIGICGGITPSELHSLITTRDLFNGYANRFFMFWAERSWKDAFPQATPQPEITRLARRTAEILRFAKGKYPHETNSRPMAMSHHAMAYYRHAHDELERQCLPDLLSTLLERRAPHLIRLAMLFAQGDLVPVIEEHHLMAAQAWIEYNTRSVKYLFAHQANEAKALEREQMAEKIVRYLQGKPNGASLTDLTVECFQRHTPKQPIGEVLDLMLIDHRYPVEMVELPRADGRPGKPKKSYRLHATRCELSELSFYPATAGVFGQNDGANLGELSFFPAEKTADPDLSSPMFASEKSAETRVDIGQKLSSLSSQPIACKEAGKTPGHSPKIDQPISIEL